MKDALAPLFLAAAFTAVACGSGTESGGASSAATAQADRTRTEPTSAQELVDRVQESLAAEVRVFELEESKGGEATRRGRLTLYPKDSQPVFALAWEGDEATAALRSDGETVYRQDPAGNVQRSAWTEAGAVLFNQAGGKLLGVATSPSSMTAYGGSLEDVGEGRMGVETGLPNGGGWTLEVSRDTWLPAVVEFRADAEAPAERLEIRLGEAPAVERSALLLEAGPGAVSEAFYAGPAPGDPAPDVTFELADGGSVALADLRGSVVALDFWATWCVPCRGAMKSLQALHEEHAEDGLKVYGLRLFDSGDPTAFLEELGVTYPTGDGAPFVESYAVGTYGLPSLYIIRRDGTVGKLIVGFSEENEAALEAAIEEALAS